MPANRISKDKRALILSALSEGMAINSVCRMFKTNKNVALRFISEVGMACEDYHNRNVRVASRFSGSNSMSNGPTSTRTASA